MKAYVSGPLIACLLDCHRDSVNEAMLAGRYGATFIHDRVRYASLEAVEKAIGIQFTEAQVERAAQRGNARILTVHPQEAVYLRYGPKSPSALVDLQFFEVGPWAIFATLGPFASARGEFGPPMSLF
jgi:hypothetical protein